MSKTKKIIIGVLVVALLLGTCFGSLAFYAKKTLNKPKFKLPEDEPVPSASELPADKETLCAYVNSLYGNACKADNAEGSWHTDINLGGDISAPFSDADKSIITYIKDNAAGQISDLYPRVSEQKMSEAEDAPVITVNPADVDEFTAERGHTDAEGNVSDDGYYFVTFSMKPESLDTESIASEDVYLETCKLLSAVASLEETVFDTERYEISYKIDRVTDQIISVDVSKDYQIKAKVVLTDDFSSLLSGSEDKTAEIEMPFKSALRVGFKWYGARFTQRSMAVRPNDMKSLPADVKVNTAATKDDFSLTFTPSVDGAVSIDEDGVMTVNKNALDCFGGNDGDITIEMKLEYEGKTYTDELTLYITGMEVETNV